MFCSGTAVEAFKNQLSIFHFNYGTLVMDRNQKPLIFFVRGDNDRRIGAGVLCSVHNEFCNGHGKELAIRRNHEIFIRYAHFNRMPTKLIGAVIQYFLDQPADNYLLAT